MLLLLLINNERVCVIMIILYIYVYRLRLLLLSVQLYILELPIGHLNQEMLLYLQGKTVQEEAGTLYQKRAVVYSKQQVP